MIDFTDMPKKNKFYAGANGSKISVIYNEEQYMIKFPSQAAKNQDISYSNSCISEYLGCKIFESVGIPVQETMLGTYTTKKGGEKIVVACKDFTSPGVVLQDFASLKNQIIDSERNGYGTDLEDITSVFMEQTAVDTTEISNRFWDMFIIDALIGNWDRHNGNWGFLYDTREDSLVLAPVFDCGSSLYPQADEKMIEKVLGSRQEIHHRIFNIPLSAIQYKGKKINYYEFISSLQNEECNRALKRLMPSIDMEKIVGIIEETPVISDRQKTFYETMLSERKERILDFSLKKLRKVV
jgi:hypothetical protein